MSKSAQIPEKLYYTKDHEWATVESDGSVRVGITDYAQESLHEVVFVDLPKVGTRVKRSDPLGTVESVKAVSEVYSPVSGEIEKTNTILENSPEIVNKDPYGKGWIAVIRPSALDEELKSLLSSVDYADLLAKESRKRHS